MGTKQELIFFKIQKVSFANYSELTFLLSSYILLLTSYFFACYLTSQPVNWLTRQLIIKLLLQLRQLCLERIQWLLFLRLGFSATTGRFTITTAAAAFFTAAAFLLILHGK